MKKCKMKIVKMKLLDLGKYKKEDDGSDADEGLRDAKGKQDSAGA
jgi:hypothetical protein